MNLYKIKFQNNAYICPFCNNNLIEIIYEGSSIKYLKCNCINRFNLIFMSDTNDIKKIFFNIIINNIIYTIHNFYNYNTSISRIDYKLNEKYYEIILENTIEFDFSDINSVSNKIKSIILFQ